MREGVIGPLDSAERRALDLVKDRTRELKAEADARQRLYGAVQAAEAERHKRAAALEQALSALEGVRQAAQPKIRASAAWKAQEEKIAEAIRIADESEKKAKVAEEDREQKRKPYETDPLFMYLWNAKFGQADYRGGNIARFFDRMIANKVGFADARANYAMLNEIPTRLREHAERRKAAIETERQGLAKAEAEALKELGAADLVGKVEAPERADRSREGAVVAKATLDEFRNQGLGIPKDPAYDKAVQALAEAEPARRTPPAAGEAQRTPTPDDDRLVRQIAAMDQKLARAESEVEQIRAEARDMALGARTSSASGTTSAAGLRQPLRAASRTTTAGPDPGRHPAGRAPGLDPQGRAQGRPTGSVTSRGRRNLIRPRVRTLDGAGQRAFAALGRWPMGAALARRRRWKRRRQLGRRRRLQRRGGRGDGFSTGGGVMSIRPAFRITPARGGRVSDARRLQLRDRLRRRAHSRLRGHLRRQARRLHTPLRRPGALVSARDRDAERTQLSLVAPDELAAVATDMGIPRSGPNGSARTSSSPASRTLRCCRRGHASSFAGGVTVRIDGLNVPCRFSGRSVARHFPDRADLDLAFVKAARRRRGLVGWVEKPGVVRGGEAVEARVPEQWVYGRKGRTSADPSCVLPGADAIHQPA